MSSFLHITKDKCVCVYVCKQLMITPVDLQQFADITVLKSGQLQTVAYKFVFMQFTDMNVFGEEIYFYT